MNGLGEGGLGLQSDDGRGCATCVKDRKESLALVHLLKIEFHAAIIVVPCVLSDLPLTLWWIITWRLRLFLYLISFLLFPCASVWENTRG